MNKVIAVVSHHDFVLIFMEDRTIWQMNWSHFDDRPTFHKVGEVPNQ